MVNLKNCTLDEFFNKTSHGKVYAFGASAWPRNFSERNTEYHLEKIIYAFVDNDSTKWSSYYNLGDRSIPIISPESLSDIIKLQDKIIVTTLFYYEIIEQLDKLEQLDNVECYIFPLVEGSYQKARIDSKLFEAHSKKEQIIPKTIHYCWFGPNELSEKEKKCIESWKKYCPNYEIICWNETNYNVSKNQYMKDAYSEGKWAFVSDYARLDIIYNYGGIYLDTDVEIIKPIDVLLTFDAFCGFANRREVALGLGFGAVRNNDIIKKLLDIYKKISFYNKDGTLNLTACPIYHTKLLANLGLKQEDSFQMIGDMAVFPTEVLCGMNAYTKQIEITPNTYAIHHYNASWTGDRLRKNYRESCEKNKRILERLSDYH